LSAPLRLILPGLLVVALAGCTPPDAGDGGIDGGAAAGGGTVAECVMGHTWNADVPDIGDQLFAQLQANGSPATSAEAVGTQTLAWGADGGVQVDTNYTFTVVAPLSDGLILTMNQTHAGPTIGGLELDGNIASPIDWDSTGYTITTVMDINGEAAAMDFPVPDASITEDVILEVTCEGNAMTTFATAGFVTTHWTRTED
jgi:hypothetical protein